MTRGGKTERYQNLVALQPGRLAANVHHYFRQSKQIDTDLTLAVLRTASGGRSGALLLQRLPLAVAAGPQADAEPWRHLRALVGTLSAFELTDPHLDLTDLLFRLFHEEEGVRLGQSWHFMDRCRCSQERVARVLLALPAAERQSLSVDGHISVICEFCSTRYPFEERTLQGCSPPPRFPQTENLLIF